MIDWPRIERQLAALSEETPAARLLSLTLPLPHWPVACFDALEDWCFWQRPDQGLRLAGVGVALKATSSGEGRFTALAAARRGLVAGWRYLGETPRAFTGFAFAPEGGAPLPNASLWVPELLLTERSGQVSLTLSTAAERAPTALARWRSLWNDLLRPRSPRRSSPLSLEPAPLAEQAFLARGRAALAAIRRGELDKVVLTRTLELRGDAHEPAALIDFLTRHHPSCATYAIGGPGFAFIGASPETLLMLSATTVSVDALAGTGWHTSPRALSDAKNRREHDFVAQAIIAALEDQCTDILLPPAPEVMQLEGLSHLRRRILARRRAEVGPFDLIARLHPTPAVGGTPTPAALDWLERHHDRRGAWYTGGFGWLDAAGDADIVVALRCGLIEGERITLYAGAGFVAGSDPAQELAETEAKFRAMRDALFASPHRRAAA
ncbi:isochorismate synthase [Sulfuricystis thermophila]|uniref:isochorismate synthase n=1 Tax=Sulfuricystis thermophila TaxID=2496847 RepID=UPI0010363DB5|nr:isochorismate synthase [Sulfuricystis thermophila]